MSISSVSVVLNALRLRRGASLACQQFRLEWKCVEQYDCLVVHLAAMSKSRNKRRLRAKKHTSRARRHTKKQAPVSWTWKDRLLLLGIALSLLAVGLGARWVIDERAYQRRIEERAQQWQSKYDLQDSQVEQLLAIEAEFYAYKKPFSFRSPPTEQERDKYRKEISDILGVRNPKGAEEQLED
ncbi:hypothetical protein N9230_06250 [Akkermansiaceae bacterium]|nr:hypothetical protein [Akkermansiaceae bacterium]